MPVQKKSNTAGPGEKQKKSWLQIAVVAFIVIVVVMCVLSFSNVSNFWSNTGTSTVSGGTIAEGDAVAIYFTTNIGNTTTFSYVGESINDVPPYRIVADSNSSIEDNDYTSIMLSIGNSTIPYGVYAIEQNAIAKELVGKQYGETVEVTCPFIAYVSCTADDLTSMGYNMSEIEVGDLIPMTLGYTDILGNQEAYLRNGVVSSINEDLSGLILNCGCDTLDVISVGKYSA
ncbi:MAG TPA: hypothetical protein O0X27_04445 [Methanocorpusculum sp.]|nr:hypothetical protein [Methanocorpusculum sp.]